MKSCCVNTRSNACSRLDKLACCVVPGILVTLLLSLFDKRTETAGHAMCWVVIVLGGMSFLRDVGTWVRGFALGAVSLSAAAAIAAMLGASRAAVGCALQSGAIWLWLLDVLLLAACTCLPRPSRLLQFTLLSVIGYGTLCLVAVLAARDPALAAELFAEEVASYIGLFAVILNIGMGTREISVRWFTAAWVIMATILVLMLCVAGIHASGHLPARLIGERKFIRSDENAPWRLQFPFEHHNRTAFFAMCALFLSVAGRWVRIRPAATWLAVAAAFTCMLLTLTRGAMLAAGAGAVVFAIGTIWISLGDRRLFRGVVLTVVAVAVVLGLTWAILPGRYKARLQQVTTTESYTPGLKTTMGSRMIVWREALRMIAARPLSGYGYGYESFERIFLKVYPNALELGGTPHAHNQWLETAAESGVPCSLMLLFFTVMRFVLLIAALRCSRVRDPQMAWLLALWIALEVAIEAYGLSNYALRRTLGLIPWAVWGVGVVLSMRAIDRARTPEDGR